MNLFSVDKADKDALWSSSTAGFSLVELLVTIAVMGMVAGMVFTQRASFSQSISLKNVTQEIAVAIRQAQVYGTASRGSGLNDDYQDFTYGMYFDTDDAFVGDAPLNQQFRMFRDDDGDDGDEGYESGDTLIEAYQLPSNMRVLYLCLNGTFGDTSCSSDDRNHLVIRFSRPHPDAVLTNKNGDDFSHDTAVIVVEEIDSGNQRKVIIQSSGYITVE